MRTFKAIVLAIFFVLLTTATASADDFEKIVAEGFKHYNDGDFDGAIEKFFEAKFIKDEPELIYNIARSYDKKGECISAQKHYEQFLARGDAPEETMEKARGHLERLGVCSTEGTLSLACAPAESTVTIDGNPLGPCAQYQLEQGTHVLIVQAEGYKPINREVVINPDQVEALTFQLEYIEPLHDPTPTDIAGPTNWLALGLIGGGAAFILTAAVVDQINYHGNAKELEKYPVGDSRRDDYEDSYEINQSIMWICGGIGLAAAITGSIFLATDIGMAESNAAVDPSTGYSWSLSPTVNDEGLGGRVEFIF